MKSPFPGMDPYIEACGLWEDFHGALIYEIKNALAAVVPDRYLVRSGERSYVVLVQSGGRVQHPFVPDVRVSAQRGRRKPAKKGATAVADPVSQVEPILMCAFVEEEHREAFIDIYEAGPGQRLVTSIEVLSPSNQRPNSPGWDLYQRKRQSLLLAGVNLVEIDLVRGGQRMPMLDPWPDSPYSLLVTRRNKALFCKVWPVHFQQPLPPLPVPLAKPDPDIFVHLQPMIGAIYERFRYEQTIDYKQRLTPALSSEEAVWVKERLRSRRPSRH